ncbi:MAG: cyclase family protein [Desulfovibrionaceae bacterium]|nr:cyclase family protein [Desulfovibrionaceae bacterium]MBF0513230.1 cyclase family protein [Desulfovibrionaceae bacterium]
MRSPWIDVSVPLRTGLAHWPGDPATCILRVKELERGDPCTVSRLEMCAHAGTHMDSPAHFIPGGGAIDSMPLDTAIGRARVIAIEDPESIKPRELAEHRLRRGERILFKTLNSARCWDGGGFVEDFVHISVEAAAYLAKLKVGLVGVDYLSVGGFFTDGAATHRELLGAGIWIIEGLDLSQVEPGRVQLVCLPLKLAGAEGSPARAIVRPLTRRHMKP